MNAVMDSNTPKAKRISKRLLLIIGTFVLSLFLFSFLAREIWQQDEQQFDRFMFSVLEKYQSAATTKLMLFFTFFGSTKFLFPAYLCWSLYLIFFRKNKVATLNIAAIGLGSAAVLHLVKYIFHRHRPPHPLIETVSGFSFPSGHSFSTFTLAALLVYSVWQSNLVTSIKVIISLLLFSFAAMVAISRVYLQVHYASDVLAGLCLSIIWVTISLYALTKFVAFKKGINKNDEAV